MIKTPISAKPILHFSIFSAKNSSSSNPAGKFFLFQISNFATSAGGGNSSATTYPSRRHEEESRSVRVSVWWDFENCNVPTGVNVFRVAQSITAAVRANGIKGPIQITAFGDIMQMSRQKQEALSATGINLNHIPNGGKNSADRSLLVDLMYWVSQNPPPAHLFLISGDRDFAGILHRLRMNNYNILLASTHNAPGVLCSAASIMWQWSSLLKGENLSGKHFNQPPDGPYGSWYGHYKAPLEDPFADLEKPACPQASVQSACLKASTPEPSTCPMSEYVPDSVSEGKGQSIPKEVVKLVRHILHQYPKGLAITDLRAELSSNFTIDKEYYGHKKFSKFLLAMPNILKLQSGNDGQFFVRGVTPKIPEKMELNQGSGVSKGPTLNSEVDSDVAAKSNDGRGFYGDQSDAKSSVSPHTGRLLTDTGKLEDPSTTIQMPTETSPKLKVESPTSDLQQPRTEPDGVTGEMKEPPVVQVGNAKATETELSEILPSPVSEVGFFKNIWKKWFGKKNSGLEGKMLKETNGEVKDVKPLTESGVSLGEDSSSCDSDVGIQAHEDVTSTTSQATPEKSKTRGSGSVLQSLKTMLWGSSVQPYDSGVFDGETNEVEFVSDKSNIFGEESFWVALKTYLGTHEASAIIKLSRTRRQLLQDLKTQGPPVLTSLSEADLIHLAELMILDKKWIIESPEKSYPFKLVLSDEKVSSSQSRDVSRHSNGLSSIFSNAQQASSSPRLRAIVGEKRHAPDSEVSKPAIAEVPTRKPRSEIMSDCQKLVDEIVKKYPEGFDMGSFRKAFSERFGYKLDIQRLGYSKLSTLLQIMPGVRVESSFILPAGNVAKLNSGGPLGQEIDDERTELSEAFLKENDNFDSPWEELGPVDNSISERNGRKRPALNSSIRNETGQKLDHGYESVSDEYLTDSEEETPLTPKPESPNKIGGNEGESSLLQILDSWYGTKEDKTKMDAHAVFSRNGSRVLNPTRSNTNSETPVINNPRKQRSVKNYSFVKDQASANNEKLIDGILSGLNKSSEGSAETKI
ncbi:OLC1v1008835C1 [Oldenlandia corymbosa var. corymbosa]|uniref:OLC1v1008835C1 n=1 Tax=Oldenlandia corymbosa var. corymbosa TaxID=529605 RepID=A0AAV1DQU6_OLDCO|nr:OLC1v1008835C1 [Oldenlandia corymbosa var. corymbosa]